MTLDRLSELHRSDSYREGVDEERQSSRQDQQHRVWPWPTVTLPPPWPTPSRQAPPGAGGAARAAWYFSAGNWSRDIARSSDVFAARDENNLASGAGHDREELYDDERHDLRAR
jgi:hypothetical protein